MRRAQGVEAKRQAGDHGQRVTAGGDLAQPGRREPERAGEKINIRGRELLVAIIEGISYLFRGYGAARRERLGAEAGKTHRLLEHVAQLVFQRCLFDDHAAE